MNNATTMPEPLLELLKQKESLTLEFKKAQFEVPKDVYETVCAFSNREGGNIFLGVRDNGEILGVREDCIPKMLKNFTSTINNPDMIFPPLYLRVMDYMVDGEHVLYIYVPVGTSVCHCANKLYDRSNEGDDDITLNEYRVYQLYNRKQGQFFVNKIFPAVKISDLRQDLLERARDMIRVQNPMHSWLGLPDDEFLRRAGMLLPDIHSETNGLQKEGVTLAGILMFGSDSYIAAALGNYKTDAMLRVYNTDRYDDRDVVETNLLDSYDRLMAFGRKHLNDSFTLDGIVNVSSRDIILREIVSNSLIHRDYSSNFIAKMVIERDKLYTENASRSNGSGKIDPNHFHAVPKNPAISTMFRVLGLSEAIGSGIPNAYTYTRLYSNAEPQFIEGDIFRVIVPLSDAAMVKVGPLPSEQDIELSRQASEHVSEHESGSSEQEGESGEQDNTIEGKISSLLEFCTEPKSRSEIQDFLGISSRPYMTSYVLLPLLKSGELKMTMPDKPRSKNQKYVKA